MNPAAFIRPRAVIFDLGKVLIEFDFRIAARALSPYSRVTPEEFHQVLDQSPLLQRYESGHITSAEFESEIRTQTGYSGTPEHFRKAFGEIFSEIPELIELQAGLRRSGIPTYIFSNTNEIAVGYIQGRFPFFSGFDGFVLSYEIGAMKPHADSYIAVERKTGLSGSELLYLDDRPENIAGGEARGWQTLLHHSPAATIAEVLRRVRA